MAEEGSIKRIKRGLTHIIEEDEFDEVIKGKRKLRVKLGIDPTASLIHIGHLVLLFKLRDFQEAGHEVCLIMGDFTATIGDPSERMSARPKMSKEEVSRNAKVILEKCMRFLIKEKTRVYFNSTWLGSLTSYQLFELFSKGTVAKLLTRDDFKKRLEEGRALYVHEFLYPFLQAYDSVVVRADVELGGNDQLFNLMLGREIMRSFGLPPQICITTPLIEGLDGKLKMSKTYGNYISVDEKPEDVYGKLMGIPDELTPKYAELLCRFDEDELRKIKELHPFEAKSKVAFRITELLCGRKKAEEAKEWFDRVIRKREIPDISQEVEAKEGDILQKVLKSAGVVKSVSEAVRLTESGGLYINGERVQDRFFELKKGEYNVRVGKTKFIRIKVK